ncbi:hypothetical protein B0H13DRAFT_1891930 [Mycena leptocephala]|nr:hypothetical protein B0H13DRAFT_1891930 [Mycena leptocephala]
MKKLAMVQSISLRRMKCEDQLWVISACFGGQKVTNYWDDQRESKGSNGNSVPNWTKVMERNGYGVQAGRDFGIHLEWCASSNREQHCLETLGYVGLVEGIRAGMRARFRTGTGVARAAVRGGGAHFSGADLGLKRSEDRRGGRADDVRSRKGGGDARVHEGRNRKTEVFAGWNFGPPRIFIQNWTTLRALVSSIVQTSEEGSEEMNERRQVRNINYRLITSCERSRPSVVFILGLSDRRSKTETPRKMSNNQNFDLFMYAVVSLKNVQQLPLLKASYHGTTPQHKRENSAYHPDLGQFYHAVASATKNGRATGPSGASLGLELSEDWWRSWAYNVPTRHSSCGGGVHKHGQSENELGVGVAHRLILSVVNVETLRVMINLEESSTQDDSLLASIDIVTSDRPQQLA